MLNGNLPCTPFDRWQAANDEIGAVFERTLVDILNPSCPSGATPSAGWRGGRAIRKPRSSRPSGSSRRRSRTGCARCSAASTGGISCDSGSDATGLDAHWQPHVNGNTATLQAQGLGHRPAARPHDLRRPAVTWSAPLVQSGPLSEDAPLTVDYLNVIRSVTLEQLRNEQYTVSVPERPLLYALTCHAALPTYVDTAVGILATRGMIEATAARDVELVQVTGDAEHDALRAAQRGGPRSHRPGPTAVLHRPAGCPAARRSSSTSAPSTPPSTTSQPRPPPSSKGCSPRRSTPPVTDSTRGLRRSRPSASPPCGRVDQKGLLVGAYGWLENVHPSRPPRPPTPASEPAADPGSGGYLLTPSVDQATAARPAQRVPHPCRRRQRQRVAIDLSSRRVRRELTLLTACATGTRSASCSGDASSATCTTRPAPGDPELDQYVAVAAAPLPARGHHRHRGSGATPTRDVPTAASCTGCGSARRTASASDPVRRQDLPGFGTPEHTAIENTPRRPR